MYSEFLHNKFEKKIILNILGQTDVDHVQYCFGIINLTPDSFSDGSPLNSTIDYQLQKINEHVRLKADVIDIGAESTKPNAAAVSAREEYERLLPFLKNYQAQLPLSLDTRSPEVIKKVFSQRELCQKIKFINNVSGMQDIAFVKECSKNCPTDIKFIAMHAKGAMPPKTAARDVADAFYEEDGGLENHMFKFFEKTIKTCEEFSIKKERLILDPGFGFAKNIKQSFEIINIIPKLKKEFGLPIFVGSSRKSFLRLWADKISELGFKPESLTNAEMDILTVEFNNLLTDVDYFRMHA